MVIADSQLQGRGREERTWISLPKLGMYATWGISSLTPSCLPYVSLAMGLSVIKTLEMLVHKSFTLKWPNDILYEGKKISGILIENLIQDQRIFSMIGIGINLNHEPQDFDESIRNQAISLKMVSGNTFSNLEVSSNLTQNIFFYLDRLKEGQYSLIIQKANTFMAPFQNQKIRFHIQNQIQEGICQGIAADGALLLKTANGQTQKFLNGEIINLSPLQEFSTETKDPTSEKKQS